ncbi:CDGSH iron-sulfur domain-containing protein [bacterium AH-315-C07]|nr:CDGSH iron-sulfur domain-containing protein [bacterium AH-315-C07]
MEEQDKPQMAGTSPATVQLEEGNTYAWCACGRSGNQPFCDGSHAETSLKPIVFKAEKTGPAALCMCKRTGNGPYCDGTHRES